MAFIEGTYTFTVTGTIGVSSPLSEDVTWTLTTVNPCKTATLTIQPSILSTTAIEFVIGSPDAAETLDVAQVVSSETDAICPAIVLSVTDSMDGALDGVIFDH